MSRELTELFRDVGIARLVEEACAVVVLGDHPKSLFGTYTRAIQRAAAADAALVRGRDLGPEPPQPHRIHAGLVQAVTVRSAKASLLERIGDDDELMNRALLGLSEDVLKHAVVLGPSRPMLDSRHGARQLLGVAEPFRGPAFAGLVGIPVVAAEIDELHFQSGRAGILE